MLGGACGELKSVRESVGLHGEMDDGMRSEGVIACNLTFDGASKGLGVLDPEIIVFSGIPMLLEGGLKLFFV